MEVTFQLNPADHAALFRALKLGPRRMIWSVLLLMAVIFLPQGLEGLTDGSLRARFEILGWQVLAPLGLMLFATLAAYIALHILWVWLDKAWTKADFKKIPELSHQMTLTVDDEGISPFAWSSFERIIETDAHFFVMIGPQSPSALPSGTLIVPKRAFDSPAQCAEFGALLQRKWAQHRLDAAPIVEAK